MWNSLSIAKKIWIGLAVLVMGYMVSVTLVFVQGQKGEDRLHIIAKDLLPATTLSHEVLTAFDEQVRLYADAVMMEDEDLLAAAKQEGKTIESALRDSQNLSGLDGKKKKVIDELLKDFLQYNASAITVYTAMSIDVDNLSDADALSSKAIQLAQQSVDLRNKFIGLKDQIAEQLQAELSTLSADTKQQRYLNVVMCSAVIIATLVLVALIISRSITEPLRRSIEVVNKIAKGEIPTEIKHASRDEIGQLFKSMTTMTANLAEKAQLAEQISQGNLAVDVPLASEHDQLGLALQQMVSSLKEIVTEMQGSSQYIVDGATRMSDVSQKLSQGTTESAASLEEISASMNEVASQIEHNAANAKQANVLSAETMTAASGGNMLMNELVEAMDTISQSSRDINKINKVIDEIAFQTNLLALNAAVEAARAGQHGKGFAVVAEEVRNLAARSANAAKETSTMIEDSLSKADSGVAVATKTAAALYTIVSVATKVTALIGEIDIATSEQSNGISQTEQGLSQIDRVVQQNTSTAVETASTAETLAAQAMHMEQLLGHFSLGSTGGQKRLG